MSLSKTVTLGEYVFKVVTILGTNSPEYRELLRAHTLERVTKLYEDQKAKVDDMEKRHSWRKDG